MRTTAPAITTALLVTALAVRLHRAAITRARAEGYLAGVRDVRRGLLDAQ